MGRLEDLWQLQDLRKQYYGLKKERDALQGSPEIRGLNDRLSAVKANLAVVRGQVQEKNKDYKRKEMDYEALVLKKNNLQEELYSGKANAKELSNLQQRVEETGANLAKSEEEAVALSLQIEELKESEKQVTEEMRGLETQLQAAEKECRSQINGIQKEMSIIKSEHDRLVKEVNPRDLDVYNRKFKQFSTTAVAGVASDICGGCNVHLPRYILVEIRKGEDLIACENCGRILYYRP